MLKNRVLAAVGLLSLIGLLLLGCSAAGPPPDEAATRTIPPAPSLEGIAAAAPEESTAPAEPGASGSPAAGDEPAAAYPGPTTTPRPYEPPAATSTPPSPQASPENGDVFLPLVQWPDEPTQTPLPPTETPAPTPTPIPTLDFAAVRQQVEAQGQSLAYSKIGFHVAVGGNRNGLGEWMGRLDEAGVPFFLKSVGDSGPLVEAQELIRRSGVPHVLVFRTAGNDYDTPDYNLPPAEAARQHWERHMAVWPPELDRDLVWLETINEIDKNQSEWLGRFALETAALAERDGFKWAAFGWSSGEPEVADWQQPSMMAFLRLAGANPDRLAIALHEYSYLTGDIRHDYPFKVGRFHQLFQVCDAFGIPRPTILITEWGWEYENVPSVDRALEDIAWANRLYAPYPEIKGAAIWYLGNGFGEIATQAQKLIYPVMVHGLTNYYTAPPAGERAAINPEAYR